MQERTNLIAKVPPGQFFFVAMDCLLVSTIVKDVTPFKFKTVQDKMAKHIIGFV